MTPATTSLVGFSREISWPLGQISLMVSLGNGEHSIRALMNFMIVQSPSPYNDIIRRSRLRKIQAVPSTAHGMLKFSVREGILTLHSSTIVPTECKMIQMAKKDKEKIGYHTSQGVYCYTKMPFGLKNVGATYQRLVDKAFEKQIGRNFEVYVDDMVIKNHTEQEILRDVEETFQNLRKINMKLNPNKCTFGAEAGMFLGHIIKKGIKSCLEKEEAAIKL
ncbi:reverse transcriptase domain-containing protein [Tanacetum coccineum]